jgi:hypothetical protein
MLARLHAQACTRARQHAHNYLAHILTRTPSHTRTASERSCCHTARARRVKTPAKTAMSWLNPFCYASFLRCSRASTISVRFGFVCVGVCIFSLFHHWCLCCCCICVSRDACWSDACWRVLRVRMVCCVYVSVYVSPGTVAGALHDYAGHFQRLRRMAGAARQASGGSFFQTSRAARIGGGVRFCRTNP